jgi:hypothetical protein
MYDRRSRAACGSVSCCLVSNRFKNKTKQNKKKKREKKKATFYLEISLNPRFQDSPSQQATRSKNEDKHHGLVLS